MNIAPFADRRARLCARMQPGAVAILPTAPEVPRNSDTDYPYRHDSYFYYLTGFTEPDSVLVLVAAHGAAAAQAILFCRQKTPSAKSGMAFATAPTAPRQPSVLTRPFRSKTWTPKWRACWPTPRPRTTRSDTAPRSTCR